MAEKKTEGAQAPELETLIKGLLSQPGVEGYMTYNETCTPIKWSGYFAKTGAVAGASIVPASVTHHAGLLGDLTVKAQATGHRLFGEAGSIQLLRLRTQTGELMIAPGEDATLAVYQRAHSAVMLPLAGDGKAAAEIEGGGGKTAAAASTATAGVAAP